VLGMICFIRILKFGGGGGGVLVLVLVLIVVFFFCCCCYCGTLFKDFFLSMIRMR
jgi:hypothetical protein